MPKVNWCQTKTGKQEAAAQELMRYIDAARAFAGLTTEQLASLAGISRQLYSRRRSAPQDLTVAELQKLTAVLHLDKFPGASDAMLRLLA